MRARLAAAAATLLAGCTVVEDTAFQAGIPGVRTPFTVESSVVRGPYRDAMLTRERITIRTFTADDEACRTLLEPGATVSVADVLPGAKIRDGGDLECLVLGRGSLEQRRTVRPEGQAFPRGQAVFQRVLYSDEEVILTRGRIPLTGLVGVAGGHDIVAVFPNTKECRERIAGGVGTIEYYAMGDSPLMLVTDAKPCPVLGLLEPIE